MIIQFFILCAQFCNIQMKKRKLDINQIKKLAIRGRQSRTITTKYEVVLSFFKQKDSKFSRIFTVQLDTLIADLLDQLSNAQITYKLENSLQGEIHTVQVHKDSIKLDTSCLKYICKEFPIRQIVECLEIKKDSNSKKVSIQVLNTKLMNFFKHLRSIFPEFCSSVGEKIIVDTYDLRSFYETFKCQWNKLHEKGKIDNCEKIEKLLCRCLFFLGALIENNIFAQIQSEERLKREEAADISTKSQKKPTLKGINNQVSSTYSFGGEIDLVSHHLSSCLMSQKSNQQSFCKTGYSQKSQRLVRKQRNSILWERAQIKNLKINIKPNLIEQKPIEGTKFEIDLLSNDVQNILIEQAFKIQRFKIESGKYRQVNTNQYLYNTYLNYYPPYYGNYQSPFIYTQILGSEQNRIGQNQGKRNASNNHTNFVEIRKTHSRLENNKYS